MELLRARAWIATKRVIDRRFRQRRRFSSFQA
jgi:hypothetical protein